MPDLDLLLRLARGLAPGQSGPGLYQALVQELHEILGSSHALIAVAVPGHRERARTLAVRGPDGPEADFEYDLAGTPCASVMHRDVCVYPDGVGDLFPDDALLGELGIRGYAGARLLDSTGNPLGVLAALYRQPIAEPERAKAILSIFATRATAEIERESFDERLRAREQNLQNLVLSSPMGIHEHAVDGAGRLVFVGSNPAADRFTGMDSNQLLGMETELAFPGLQNSEVPEHYRRAALEGIPWEVRNFDYDAEMAGGVYDVYAFQTSPNRMAAMFLEVSDRLRAEKALRQAQKMEAVGQLAGGVAHDFNNLLQAINGYTELAMQDLPPGHPARRSLGQVARASLRASSLTRRLLAFSRQEVPSLRPVALEPLLEDILRLLERILGENVAIDLAAQPGLKCALADPGQIEQVLFNLCINARDAMPGGGRISVTARREVVSEAGPPHASGLPPGEYDLVTVSDTGCGIPPDQRKRIFEPFFTTKERGRGTGLGLPMVESIMKGLGGRVLVESEVGRGSSFGLYFPVTDLPAPEAPAEEDLPERPWQGGLILVAEDDDLLRHLTAEVLERSGCRVASAATGEEALRLFRERASEVRLAVLDVLMPRMGGHELHRRLRQEGSRIPVLFTSGYSGPAPDEAPRANGGVDWLAKPYSPRQLMEKVRHLLSAGGRREGPPANVP